MAGMCRTAALGRRALAAAAAGAPAGPAPPLTASALAGFGIRSSARRAASTWPGTAAGPAGAGPAPHWLLARRLAPVQDSFAVPVLEEADWYRLYTPAAVRKADIHETAGATVVRFRMWKLQGYLHCQASTLPYPLVLPVFLTDGCGYPAMSAILRKWQLSESTRWDVFLHYLTEAAEAGERSCDPAAPPGGEPFGGDQQISDDIPFVGQRSRCEQLDRRFDTDTMLQDWFFQLLPGAAQRVPSARP